MMDDIATTLDVQKKTVNLTYPREGGEVTLQEGVTEIDFYEGEVRKPDGTVLKALSSSLEVEGEEYIKSLKILCDNDVVIWGQAHGRMVLGKMTYKALSNLPLYYQTIRRLYVDAPANTNFSIIASTHPRAFGSGGTPYSRVYTFHEGTIESSTTGTEYQVNEYREATIVLDVQEINPAIVSGGGNTTLTADTSVNDKTINVVDESNFAADDWAVIGSGSSRELVKIKSVSTGQLTLYYGMINTHSSGDTIQECYEQRLKVEIQISPDKSTWVHRDVIINEDMEGDLERTTAPRAEESEIFACGQFQSQLKGHLGKYMRVKLTMTKAGGSPSFKVKCLGNFVGGV